MKNGAWMPDWEEVIRRLEEEAPAEEQAKPDEIVKPTDNEQILLPKPDEP
jgi:hypothetical protein